MHLKTRIVGDRVNVLACWLAICVCVVYDAPLYEDNSYALGLVLPLQSMLWGNGRKEEISGDSHPLCVRPCLR